MDDGVKRLPFSTAVLWNIVNIIHRIGIKTGVLIGGKFSNVHPRSKHSVFVHLLTIDEEKKNKNKIKI